MFHVIGNYRGFKEGNLLPMIFGLLLPLLLLPQITELILWVEVEAFPAVARACSSCCTLANNSAITLSLFSTL